MNKNIVFSAMLAALLASGASAFAQDRHQQNERMAQQHDERNDRGDHRNDKQHDDHRGDDHGRPQNGHAQPGNRGVGPRHDLHKGNRLPAAYRSKQHVVNDWRARRLSPPPRGHQWVKVDNDYVLMAAATGLIAQIILGN